jgi:hypothetical protein
MTPSLILAAFFFIHLREEYFIPAREVCCGERSAARRSMKSFLRRRRVGSLLTFPNGKDYCAAIPWGRFIRTGGFLAISPSPAS